MALAMSMGLAACDGGAPAVDASTPLSARTSAVSLRIDVPASKPASLTVLAFRAAFSGVAAADVLGLVDPLAATAPARDCQLRDIGQSAAELVARGDAIELEELAGVGVSLGAGSPDIHPSPRLYPDLAATIGGVVGEAGPFGMAVIPEQVKVQSGAVPVTANGVADTGSDAAMVAVPAAGWVRLMNGAVPHDGSLVEVGADLNLNLATTTRADARGETSGDSVTSLELRPFGATVALACLVPANAVPNAAGGAVTFMVPRQALAALVSVSGAARGASVAAALDLVRRSQQRLPLSATRVSVEVRTSTFVELRP
ncbi:MAG: hypothetical protein ABUS79_01160 [Pseudomonadota bacterium]